MDVRCGVSELLLEVRAASLQTALLPDRDSGQRTILRDLAALRALRTAQTISDRRIKLGLPSAGSRISKLGTSRLSMSKTKVVLLS